jgi:hypothetical protein
LIEQPARLIQLPGHQPHHGAQQRVGGGAARSLVATLGRSGLLQRFGRPPERQQQHRQLGAHLELEAGAEAAVLHRGQRGFGHRQRFGGAAQRLQRAQQFTAGGHARAGPAQRLGGNEAGLQVGQGLEAPLGARQQAAAGKLELQPLLGVAGVDVAFHRLHERQRPIVFLRQGQRHAQRAQGLVDVGRRQLPGAGAQLVGQAVRRGHRGVDLALVHVLDDPRREQQGSVGRAARQRLDTVEHARRGGGVAAPEVAAGGFTAGAQARLAVSAGHTVARMQRAQAFECGFELLRRIGQLPAIACVCAGAVVPVGGGVAVAGGRQVGRDRARRAARVQQVLGHQPVQPRAQAGRQAGEHGFGDEVVLETVAAQHLGRLEFGKQRRQFQRRAVERGGGQRQRERGAGHAGQLRQLQRLRRQARQAQLHGFEQRGGQRRGCIAGHCRAGQPHRLQRLEHEARLPAQLPVQPLRQCMPRRGVQAQGLGRQRGQQGQHAGFVQRRQRHAHQPRGGGFALQPAAGRLLQLVGPRGQQQRRGGRLAAPGGEGLQAGGIGPLQVVDHDDLQARRGGQRLAPGLEHALLLAGRAQGRRFRARQPGPQRLARGRRQRRREALQHLRQQPRGQRAGLQRITRARAAHQRRARARRGFDQPALAAAARAADQHRVAQCQCGLHVGQRGLAAHQLRRAPQGCGHAGGGRCLARREDRLAERVGLRARCDAEGAAQGAAAVVPGGDRGGAVAARQQRAHAQSVGFFDGGVVGQHGVGRGERGGGVRCGKCLVALGQQRSAARPGVGFAPRLQPLGQFGRVVELDRPQQARHARCAAGGGHLHAAGQAEHGIVLCQQFAGVALQAPQRLAQVGACAGLVATGPQQPREFGARGRAFVVQPGQQRGFARRQAHRLALGVLHGGWAVQVHGEATARCGHGAVTPHRTQCRPSLVSIAMKGSP